MTIHGRVLLADDEPSVRLLLERSLQDWGYEVAVAEDGQRALELLGERAFDVVLTDIRMPRVGGLELVRWVRRERPATDVILMTGYASLETATEGIRLGARDYLMKPFHELDLVKVALERSIGRQRLEAEADRLRRHMERYDRLGVMGELAASVSHEINGPASLILANAAVALERLSTARECRDALETNARGGARLSAEQARELSSLLDDLAAMAQESRDGARRIADISRDMRHIARDDDEKVPVSLDDVVRAAVTITGPRLRAALETRLAGDLPRIPASRGRLIQVVANLLLNAAQAVEGGGRAGSVTVTTEHDDGWVRCIVRDTGKGVDPAVRGTLFEPFVTTRAAEGAMGLGLAIATDIVRSHGGEITLQSEPGQGSTFVVALPLQPDEPPSQRTPVPAPDERLRVLVVDDEVMLLHSIRRMLQSACDVTLAEGARAALTAAAAGGFDVVLCDLVMPDVDGVAFHEELHRMDPALAEHVVFMTGGAVTSRSRQLASTARGNLLRKPFTRRELLGAIQRAAAR